MSDILADYREWAANVPTRASTHNERCHLYHTDCMVHRLARRLEEAALTDAEREAVEYFAALTVSPREDDSSQAATLRGLLERLSSSPPISDAGKSGETANEPEPAIPPAWLARPYWVDPAGGHRYGFPKLYDPAKDGDMTAWLIANGYPERLAMQELACTFTACTEDGGK